MIATRRFYGTVAELVDHWADDVLELEGNYIECFPQDWREQLAVFVRQARETFVEVTGARSVTVECSTCHERITVDCAEPGDWGCSGDAPGVPGHDVDGIGYVGSCATMLVDVRDDGTSYVYGRLLRIDGRFAGELPIAPERATADTGAAPIGGKS